MNENTYSFDFPSQDRSIIKVIGVGGGGSNAVNHMFGQGIRDVEFVVCNTDSQALQSSPVTCKLQIGANLTHGLGAGANPEKGRNAALESKEDIRELLSDGTRMVFITAGMGGGTGTGAAPVIAQIAQELDILTVGIVTSPFAFEGSKKSRAAEEGITAMKTYCDTVLVILNDKLREIFGNLPISEAFAQADNILTTAAKGIAEIITVPGHVNVDFEDVRAVMKNAGRAVMGSARASGEERALTAAEEALNSPLLNNQQVHGANRILLSIMSGEEAELQMDELTIITDYIQRFAGDECEVIFGHGVEAGLTDGIRVTVIATGYGPDNVRAIEPEEQIEPLETHDQDERAGQGDRVTFDLEWDQGFRDEELVPLSEEKTGEPFLQQPSLFDEEKEEEQEDQLRNDPISFDSLKDEIRREIEEEDERNRPRREYEFQIDGDFQDPADEEDEDAELDELMEGPAIPFSRKMQLMEERRRREELLAGEHKEMRSEDFKEKLDTPAYERKKIKLHEVPHSAERNISKFNLTDDDQLLGNNKFLHDNVD